MQSGHHVGERILCAFSSWARGLPRSVLGSSVLPSGVSAARGVAVPHCKVCAGAARVWRPLILPLFNSVPFLP